MNKFVLVGIALSALLGGSASAADMSIAKAPPPPSYSWTGCYIGVVGGAGDTNDSYTGRAGAGGLAGGEGGCNYQYERFVVGVEAQGVWSGVSNNNTVSTPGFVTTMTTHNRWDVDVALRLGTVPIEQILVYAKLGFAEGEFAFSTTTSAGFLQTGSSSFPGAVAGVGVEYALTRNVSAKLEYDFLNYMGRSVSLTCPPGVCAPSTATESGLVHMYEVGLNYKFY